MSSGAPRFLQPSRLALLHTNICETFEIHDVHDFQLETGQNTLRGKSTVLNVPTGGGKTIAFYYALFYYWYPGNTTPEDQKIVLVISPLIALMESQADDLTARGVPAVALTGRRMKGERLLENCAAGEYRVILVSPELVLSPGFRNIVLRSPTFRSNVIQLVIDEAHAICEWGTDDFRSDYRELGQLRGLLPKGTPVLCTSATLPQEVLDDICVTLCLPDDCEFILYSNAKPNIALSVRQLQHPDNSYADLVTLIPKDAKSASDIPMTLVYAGSRTVVEEIQDFLRRHLPAGIPQGSVEFYHRFIEDGRKDIILDRLRAGDIRICVCTDVLSWGIDLRNIVRVYLYKKPKTFNAMVQKYGRCVRLPTELGECVLFVTKAMYRSYEKGLAESADIALLQSDPDVGAGDEHDVDVDEDVRIEKGTDDDSALPTLKGKRLKSYAKRDEQYLIRYIGTKHCRRTVWDEFFDNANKRQLNPPVPNGARCCDNCTPNLFPIDTVLLEDPSQLQKGRRQRATKELEACVRARLEVIRGEWFAAAYPAGSHFLSPSHFLSDDLIATISSTATSFGNLPGFNTKFRWHWSPRYGSELVDAVLDERRKLEIPAGPNNDTSSSSRTAEPATEILPPPKRIRLDKVSIAAYKRYQDIFGLCRSEIEGYVDSAGHSPAKRFRSLPRRGTSHAQGLCQRLAPARPQYPSSLWRRQ
ncbi:P-loop containing nucleoside triphosphate hydrolase protein [Schizophyllum commune]